MKNRWQHLDGPGKIFNYLNFHEEIVLNKKLFNYRLKTIQGRKKVDDGAKQQFSIILYISLYIVHVCQDCTNICDGLKCSFSLPPTPSKAIPEKLRAKWASQK